MALAQTLGAVILGGGCPSHIKQTKKLAELALCSRVSITLRVVSVPQNKCKVPRMTIIEIQKVSDQLEWSVGLATIGNAFGETKRVKGKIGKH